MTEEKTDVIPEKKSARYPLVLAGILAFAIVGGYFYIKHSIHPKNELRLAQEEIQSVKEQLKQEQSTNPNELFFSSELFNQSELDTDSNIEEIIPETFIEEPISVLTETEELPLDEPKITEQQTVIKIDETAKVVNTMDLMRLRDDLILMRPCSDSLNRALPSLEKEIIALLSPLCQQNKSVRETLENVFMTHKNKSDVILHREMDASWKGVLKSWLFHFVQVRTLNPNPDKTADLLDLAHLQLEQKQIQDSIQTLNDLPPQTALMMQPYIQQAEQYLSVIDVINNTLSR